MTMFIVKERSVTYPIIQRHLATALPWIFPQWQSADSDQSSADDHGIFVGPSPGGGGGGGGGEKLSRVGTVGGGEGQFPDQAVNHLQAQGLDSNDKAQYDVSSGVYIGPSAKNLKPLTAKPLHVEDKADMDKMNNKGGNGTIGKGKQNVIITELE